MAKTRMRKPAVPMAPAAMRTDQIYVDTSRAPWMTVANAELGRRIREWKGDDSFSMLLYEAVVQLQGLGMDAGAQLKQELRRALREEMQRRNARIVGYLETVKTDPRRDPKRLGRSWELAPVYEKGGRWDVTAWCAAFVNWCLLRAGAPSLGLATADAWLRFGTPLPTPVYGCVTVIPPAKATGSTTGHVAFYVKTEGEHIVLLGGNQGDSVSTMYEQDDRVLGYRWPTAFNHFLAAEKSVVV
jgi:uncharacterized protein (TIGR02594 family)